MCDESLKYNEMFDESINQIFFDRSVDNFWQSSRITTYPGWGGNQPERKGNTVLDRKKIKSYTVQKLLKSRQTIACDRRKENDMPYSDYDSKIKSQWDVLFLKLLVDISTYNYYACIYFL